jgi:multimeric flavodoxin WrbA
MAKLLIVYHTQSGNTQALAKAIEEGAKKAGAEVVCKLAAETDERDFEWADCFAFGSPDYFSYMAGALKDVFDRVFYPVKEKVRGKPYGAFVTHGGGGTPAYESIGKIASSFGLEEKVKPLLILGKPDEEGMEKGREFGKRLVEKK